MPPLKSSILLVRKGVSSSLPDGSVEEMVANDVFLSVQVIRDNFCFDASLEKFHSPSQEGGCHHHFLMDLWMTLVRKWWRMRFLWNVQFI